MFNFLEIYHILFDSLNLTEDYNYKSLKACELLKKNRKIFWDEPDKHDDFYGTKTNYKIDNWFSISPENLDELIDLVIMPSITDIETIIT